MAFQTSAFFPVPLYRQITEVRVGKPEMIVNAAERRARPDELTYDGKLALIAADHPARGVTAAGGDPIAMGNRYEFLGRAIRVLSTEFDGVMGTVDVIEELLILDQLVVDAGGESFLDDTLLIGSLNRGGVAGAVWELDDRLTSFGLDSLSRLRLDGVKLTLRLDWQDAASGRTLDYVAQMMEELDRMNLPIFLEALPVRKGEKGYELSPSLEDMVKTIGIASALGASSANLWLKAPVVENFARVADATTLPLLMLGGATQAEILPLLEMFAQGMKAGANVRGVMAGRNVLFPPAGEDPAAIAHALDRIVHDGADARAAWATMNEARGTEIDWLMNLFK
ncbi:MAG: hypothetical protein HY259_01845 [Chloroflexi bacterium]|nr:hypothetical protein [Chloroflexota bacterium]